MGGSFVLFDVPLSIQQVAPLLCSLILLGLLSSFAFDPLRKIPGPLPARFSRLWMVKHSFQGDMHRTMIELHQKYGKLVRTGPREVSVSDLAAIKKIYSAGTKFRKSDWYSVWQGRRKFDLFAERDEQVHGSQRRLVSKIYSMDSLRTLEPYIDDAIKHFTSIMAQRTGQDVNMGLFVQLFAFGQLNMLFVDSPSESRG